MRLCKWLIPVLSFSSYYNRQFVTTTGNTFQKPKHALTSNPGIVSEITKRGKNAQNL